MPISVCPFVRPVQFMLKLYRESKVKAHSSSFPSIIALFLTFLKDTSAADYKTVNVLIISLLSGYVQTKLFPSGEKELEFEYPYKKYVEVSWTSDEAYLVCYGCEKQKYHLYVHSAKSGKLVHKFHVKYDGFKVRIHFWLH